MHLKKIVPAWSCPYLRYSEVSPGSVDFGDRFTRIKPYFELKAAFCFGYKTNYPLRI